MRTTTLRVAAVVMGALGFAGAAGCLSTADGRSAVVRSSLGEEDGGDAAAPEPTCDLEKPFETPTVVAGFDERDVLSLRLSADERSGMISLVNGSTVDIHRASRTTPAAPFVIGAAQTEIDSVADEYWPSLSADGEMIFFESSRAPGSDGGVAGDRSRIWTATRSSPDAGFGPPVVLGAFDVTAPEAAPYLHPSGRSLYFSSLARGGAGNLDLFVADITDFGVVTAVRNLGTPNTSVEESMPTISYDERALFFSRPDPATANRDIWVVGRTSKSDAFGVAQRVVEASSAADDFPSDLSRDGCRLYFVSNRAVGGVQRYRVWMAAKPL